MFTVVLAWLFYKEPVGRRAALALAIMTAGGVVIVVTAAPVGHSAGLGTAAIAVATLCWAGDNTLARPLADLDPARVVQWKALLGAALSSGVALARAETAPGATAALGCSRAAPLVTASAWASICRPSGGSARAGRAPFSQPRLSWARSWHGCSGTPRRAAQLPCRQRCSPPAWRST